MLSILLCAAGANPVYIVLNKCDLLQAKLQRGVRIRDSVPSFADRKNDLPTATKCVFLWLSFHYDVIQLLILLIRLPTAF
jgi:hypothetical protein